jgi:hypothetical protein
LRNADCGENGKHNLHQRRIRKKNKSKKTRRKKQGWDRRKKTFPRTLVDNNIPSSKPLIKHGNAWTVLIWLRIGSSERVW